jgi:hypothetical protein
MEVDVLLCKREIVIAMNRLCSWKTLWSKISVNYSR